MTREKRRNAVAAVLCAAGYCLILGCVVPFVYGIIDDRTMMEIISGQYLGKPDAHAVFSGYWYTLFLKGLYVLIPRMDWYALMYLVFQTGCTGMILYRVWSGWNTDTTKGKIYLSALVFLTVSILEMQAMVQLTFTTTAAVLGITVLFWYITADQIRYTDLGLLFLLGFLTCQVRESIFYMILPVCGVLWLFRMLERQARTLPHRLLPAAVFIILLLNQFGNRMGYGSEEWQAYHRYNMARSEVYDYADYTFPPYEGSESLYQEAGIEKKSRARTLINYNYTADDQITPEFFETYISVYSRMFPEQGNTIQKMKETVKEYIRGTAEGRFESLHAVCLAGYGILAVWYSIRRTPLSCIKILCTAGIQILLWMYLLYEGRIPERVVYSMNLMFTVTLLLLWREATGGLHISKHVPGAAAVAAILLLLTVFAVRVTELRSENLNIYERNRNIEELKEYCMAHSENFYFNDVTSLAFSTWNVELWRNDRYVMNYMSLGDWISFSPVWREKLKQRGIGSVREALYGGKQVYLICSFDKGLEYLEQLYDGVVCEETDRISEFHIYQLTEE